MNINLSCDQIRDLAKQRDNDEHVNRVYCPKEKCVEKCLPIAATRGYLLKDELRLLVEWKANRAKSLVDRNSEEYVRKHSEASFSTESHRLRINSLLHLHGVMWPTASAILHFAFPGQYPILDKYAMKAVGCNEIYNDNMWDQYISLCQDKAKQCNVSMRELDKALWMHGKNISQKPLDCS